MNTCPFCGHEYIEGVDVCDECLHSLTDLSKPRPASLAEQRIIKDRLRALRPRRALVVAPETTIGKVLEILVSQRIGCVVVALEGRVQGIFSERDAVNRLGPRYQLLLERPVGEFMTHTPETLAPDDKIAFALHKMDLGGYRHVPLVEGDQVQGVISVRDILRYVTEQILNAPAA